MIDLARFRRDGFVVVENLIPDRAIQACLDEIRIIYNQLSAARGLPTAAVATPAALTPVMAALLQADQAAYLAAARLTQHMVSLHRIGCGGTFDEALAALGLTLPVISTRPVLFFMADALKIPGGYQKTPPHQDWRSIQGSLDSVVIWVPFDDAGPADFPLEVLPGSHRAGLLASDEDVFGHKVQADALPEDSFMPLTVKRGAAVIFSTFLVHRTGQEGGPVARMAASFRFNNANEPTYVARAYPNPYTYGPDMKIITPGFPARSLVEAQFPIEEPAS